MSHPCLVWVMRRSLTHPSLRLTQVPQIIKLGVSFVLLVIEPQWIHFVLIPQDLTQAL